MRGKQLWNRDTIARATRCVSHAEKSTLDDLRNGRIEHEPEFTERLLTRLQEAFKGAKTDGLLWHAKTLTSRGSGAQEGVYGADFMGVLNVDTRNYNTAKGFLAQAKRMASFGRFDKEQWDELQAQCRKMLSVTSDSHVFVYAAHGVYVIPAISVLASQEPPRLRDLPHRDLVAFFHLHFECFVGDKKLDRAHISALDDIRLQLKIPTLSLIHLTAMGEERY